MIEFTVPGEPRVWQRAARSGKRTYTPAAMKQAKDDIALMARCAGAKLYPRGVPVAVIIDCSFKPPKKKTSSHPMKKDVDNLAKLVLDALEGVCYENDRQVMCLEISKEWADKGEPRTDVSVWRVE